MEAYEVTNKTVLDNRILCSNCNKLLNVSPIFSVERFNNIDEICGRCVKIADGYSKTRKWRQYLFEDVGKTLTFPCTNKKFGCKAVLYWDEVLMHEKICTFNGFKCPIAQKTILSETTCTWEGNVKELQNHIETSHKDNIKSALNIKWSDCKENMIFFTHVATQIITVVIKCENEDTFYCLVMINGSDIESQCYRYQLELFDENKNNSMILRKSRLEPLSLILENFDKKEKMLEIDLNYIKHILKRAQYISGGFGIVRKPKKEIALIKGANTLELLHVHSPGKPKDAIIDEKMLQELECPVCSEYMIPPIYICKTGHSICNSCKSKISSCPNCRDTFSGGRNFTLEKLTTIVNYPCHNREQGCSFVTTADKIVNHQNHCELSEKQCVLNCGWKGLRLDMFNHLNKSHSDHLNQTNTIHIYEIKHERIFYFILEHGELFRFGIKQETHNSAKKFNVEQFNFKENAPKYRYHLQFIDQSPRGLTMSVSNICQGINDPEITNSNGIAISSNLLEPYIFAGRYFYYKITITQISCRYRDRIVIKDRSVCRYTKTFTTCFPIQFVLKVFKNLA